MSDPRLTITVREAARILGISAGSAYAAVQAGQLPALRIGRRILISKVGLERLVANGGAPGREGLDAGDEP